jgi:hypothetical protein
MPSSAQTIAASGMVNGNGTAPSQDMNAEFSKNNSKPIVTIFNQIYGTSPNTASNVANLHDTILKLPKWVTGRDSTGWKSVSAQASASASAVVGAPGSPAATRSLAATIGQGASYGSAAMPWHASIQQYQGKNFDDLGIQNKSYSDIGSGGMAGHFSALKGVPGGQQSGMQDMGAFINTMGKGIDVAQLNDMFGPAAFVLRMRKFGMGYVGDLDNNLASLKIFSDEDVKKADYKIIRRTLDLVNSPSDVEKVITVMEIKVPRGVTINNLGDLVDSNKMLPPGLRAMAPAGDMRALNGPLGNMGGSYKDAAALGVFLGQTEIPSYPQLDAQKTPLTTAQIEALAPAIGFGPIPAPSIDGIAPPSLGTGPIGNPILTDVMGSASGKGFTDNYKKINAAHDSIMNSQVGQDLYNKLKLIYEADRSPPYNVSAGEVIELDSIITDFNRAVKDDPQIKAAQTAMAASIFQGIRETSLQDKAGIDISNPPSIASANGVLGMAANLPKYGVDRQQMGFRDTFTGIADKNSIYGEALLVSLLEGRNQARMSSAGVQDNITADATAILGAKILANSKKDLTPQQLENITDYAQKQGKDPAQAISNSKLFGYQNTFYVSKGYPDAS